MSGQEILKIIIQSSSKELFQHLQKQLLYKNVELFYLPQLIQIEAFVQRLKPNLVILHLDENPGKFTLVEKVLKKLRTHTRLWYIFLYNNPINVEALKASIPGNRFLMLPANTDVSHIVHNLNLLRDVTSNLNVLKNKVEISENFNYCLKLIQKENNLGDLFERLVNFLPKSVLMDYWALFAVDETMQNVGHFAQFIPPIRRQKAVITPNLERLARIFIHKGTPVSLTPQDDPQLFNKLHTWGWPVKRFYFVPIKDQQQVIGGFFVGSLENRELSSPEILLLNDLAAALAQKIVQHYLHTESRENYIGEFSDQLILNRFSEDSIFYHACRMLNQVSGAQSTVYWQFNKGFGFLFPKYYYFDQSKEITDSIEKNVIFIEKETYFQRIFNLKKMQMLQDVTHNERFSEGLRKIFATLHYHNILLVPVKAYNEVIGVFILNKEGASQEFSVWERHRIEEILNRVSKVLEDTQIVKDAQLKLKQLSRIFELGNELKMDLPLAEIVNRILQNERKSLGWNDIAVFLKDELSDMLHLVAKIGFDDTQALPIDFQQPVPEEKLQLVLNRCEKISSSYFYNVEPLGSSGDNGGNVVPIEMLDWKPGDVLIVPLVMRNKVLGYKFIADPVDRLKPSKDRVVPVEYYANQITIAIENAQLYEKLLASEERYRTLAETMSLGLVTSGLNGKIMYANPAFEELVTSRKKSVVGRRLDTFFTKKSRKRYFEIAKELLAPESDASHRVENVELELISSRKEIIPVSVYAFPYFQNDQKRGFFMVVHDLREAKRLERMKADFNSMIVHDLRSPMNVIQGFIDLIRNRVVGDINSEQEELLDIARENVKKVLTLVDNFLIASKIEVGKFSIDPKLNEINGLIERVVENHAVLMKNKKITIHLNLDRNLPLLLFDSLRVEQVLNNLLSNAMKFTPEGGDIYVESRLVRRDVNNEKKFMAQIMVRDTGVGIPPEKIDSIFEKYEQTGTEKKLNVGGTGLGLAICKEIVHLHGGEIWVESEPGKGSAFYFTFPIEPVQEKTTAPPTEVKDMNVEEKN